MKQKNNIPIFSFTNSQKALSYLAENPGKEFLGSEIQKATGLSRAGVYIALLELVKHNLVSKTQKGNVLLYSVSHNNPVVKQFKILMNVILLNPLIEILKNTSKKITLYGSASRGEDYADSDIDLFIISKDPETTKNILSKAKIKRKIQFVIKTPADIPDFREKEKVFYEEIKEGVTLWETKE